MITANTSLFRRGAVLASLIPLFVIGFTVVQYESPAPEPRFELPAHLVAVADTLDTPEETKTEPEGGVSPSAMEDAGIPVDPPPVEPVELVFSINNLMVPVAGIEPHQLVDTFRDPRSGGRIHNAIDIIADAGTPLVAVSDGRIIRKHTNRLGGHVLYLRSPGGQYAFYYAHLDGYAPGIEQGVTVQQGDTLGYVGNSGNARHTVAHLHFQAIEAGGRSDRQVYGGRKINPYTLFRRSEFYRRDNTVRG